MALSCCALLFQWSRDEFRSSRGTARINSRRPPEHGLVAHGSASADSSRGKAAPQAAGLPRPRLSGRDTADLPSSIRESPHSESLTIRGSVADRSGSPIANAEAWIRGQTAWGGVAFTTKTSSSGDFTFDSLPSPLDSASILILHPQFQTHRRDIVPRRGEISIALDPGLRVYGTVRFPDGRPVTNVRVSANARGDRPYRSITTDAEGTYVLGGFEDETVVVSCEATDDDASVRAGGSAVDFTATKSQIHIQVLNGSQAPFAGVGYHCGVGGNDYYGRATALGVIMQLVPAGQPGIVTFSHPRYGHAVGRIEFSPIGAAPQQISLEAHAGEIRCARQLTVRARSAAGTPSPFERWTVEFFDSDGALLQSADSNPDGQTASLYSVPIGPAVIRLSTPDADVRAILDVRIEKQPADEIEVRFPRYGAVRVHGARCFANARLELWTRNGRKATVDFVRNPNASDCWITSGPVSLGQYELRVVTGAGKPQSVQFDVAGEGVTHLDLSQ